MIEAVLAATLDPVTPEKHFDDVKLPSLPSRKLKLEMPLTLKDVIKTTSERKTTPSPPPEEPTKQKVTMGFPGAVDSPEHVLPSIKVDQENENMMVRSPTLRKTYLFSPSAPVSSPSMQLLSEHHSSSSPSKMSSSAKKDKEAKKLRELQKLERLKEKLARQEKKYKARSGED
jgi:hypothetical protein